MTNTEILEIVYKHFGVSHMIKKMIRNSTMDDSYKDLEQIIYIQLFKMENSKLNGLFDRGELKKWINQIIKNQRNYYKNEYQSSRFLEHSNPEENELRRLTTEHEFILDWLDIELNKYDWSKDMTKDEIVAAGEYEILKFYLSTNYSMSKIAGLFNCSTTKINSMIINAKNNIKLSYDNTFDIFINDLNVKSLGTLTQ